MKEGTGCWIANLDPREEQQTLLTTKSHFQSPQKGLELSIRHSAKTLYQDFSNDILTGH